MTTDKKTLLSLSFQELEALAAELGWKKYRAQQIFSWIYARPVSAIEEMTDLSKTDRALLSERAEIRHLKEVVRQKSVDGTEKFLFELEDGNRIESVLIPEERRLTLCISSQAGCALDCGVMLTGSE